MIALNDWPLFQIPDSALRFSLFNRLALLFLLTLGSIQTSLAQEVKNWSWAAPTKEIRRIQIDFIRGDVEIIRRNGPVKIEIRKISASGKEASVAIIATETEAGVELVDQYPRLTRMRWDECLPPTGARGNFWTSDVRLQTTVWAPQDTEIKASFMDKIERY